MMREIELPRYAEGPRLAAWMAGVIARENGAGVDSPLCAALFKALLPAVEAEITQEVGGEARRDVVDRPTPERS